MDEFECTAVTGNSALYTSAVSDKNAIPCRRCYNVLEPNAGGKCVRRNGRETCGTRKHGNLYQTLRILLSKSGGTFSACVRK